MIKRKILNPEKGKKELIMFRRTKIKMAADFLPIEIATFLPSTSTSVYIYHALVLFSIAL